MPRAISASDLTRRIDVASTKSELGELASVLNATFDRLQSAFEHQVRFTQDASHELRTPIATLRAQLEVALTHPEHADWQAVATDANDEVLRMQRLVEDLLRIARLDDAPDESMRLTEAVDLDDVVQTECAALRGPKVTSRTASGSPTRTKG